MQLVPLFQNAFQDWEMGDADQFMKLICAVSSQAAREDNFL